MRKFWGVLCMRGNEMINGTGGWEYSNGGLPSEEYDKWLNQRMAKRSQSNSGITWIPFTVREHTNYYLAGP